MKVPGLGRPKRLNATRRALTWWFGPPQAAHQSATMSIDVQRSLAYLEALNHASAGRARITLNHLLAAAIARILADFPAAVFGEDGEAVAR